MADLSIIYSKTGKGMRARNAADAGLLPKHLKLLAFIDGKSSASEILTQSNIFLEKELVSALSQLEVNGFIRPLISAQSTAEDWALTSNFTPMVVQEFKNEEAIEAEAFAKAEAKVAHEKQHAERLAAEKAKEKIRWKAEIKVRKEAEAKMQADEKARIEAEQLRKAENLAQLEAIHQAKAELKLRQEAQYATEQAQVEAERIEKAKQAQLDAERITKAENDAQLEAARSAKAVLALQQELQLELLQKAEQTKLALEQANIYKAEKETADAVAKEAARLEMARIVDQAEEKRKETENQLKAARQRAVLQLKTEEQAREKALRKAKKDEKQTREAAKAAEKNKVVQQESIQLEINRLAHPLKDAKRNDEAKNNNAKVAKQVAFVHHDAIPKLDNASKKITMQQDEPQAIDVRQAATFQDTAADLEKKLTAQQAQEKAEQIRARNEADDKAALAEKALARQEMARIAREADALRSQANISTLTKTTKSGQFEASKSAQLKSANLKKSNKESQYKAAQKNAVNVADARAHEAEKRTLIATADRQIAAKLQAQIKVPTKTIRTPIDLSLMRLRCLKWLVKQLKITLTIGFISALLLIAALHFVNISPLIAPIEKLATVSFGSPVHITQVRASLWPQPQFTLGNVAIGDALKVTSIQVAPDVGTLFDNVKRVKSAQIQGVTIDRNNLEASLNLIKQLERAPTLQIAQLNVSNLCFKANDLVLGPFDGNLVLSAAGELTSLDLHCIDSALIVQINYIKLRNL